MEFMSPEDIHQMMQEKMERAQLEAIEESTRMEAWVFGMDQETLHTFSQLLGLLISEKRMTVYFQGMVDALLRERHKVCPTHNVNHDEESLAESAEEIRAENEDENVQKYNLVGAMGGGYRCKKCNYYYPSLEDRMLKAPEECPGCEVKAKFG